MTLLGAFAGGLGAIAGGPGAVAGGIGAIAGGMTSGVLHALALHSDRGAGLAWIALVPLMIVAARAMPSRVAWAAMAYAITVLFADVPGWLTPAVARYFHLTPPLGHLAVAAVTGWDAIITGLALGLPLALRRRAARPLGVLFPAALWATRDSLLAFIPPFFPVTTLATTQGETPFLQIASVTGVAGVSMLVAAGNAALAGLVTTPSRRARLATLVTVAALTIAAELWGSARLAGAPARRSSAEPFRVLLVDGAAASAAESTLDRYLAFTTAHVDPAPDLIAWPESALPTDLERDAEAWTRLRAFVDAHGTTLVTGGAGSSIRDGRVERFNSVHVFRPLHAMTSYHKRLRVPFAESWPAILGTPPPAFEPVAAGRVLLVTDADAGGFGPLICFEINDAASFRELARRGARFVLNVNNDAYWDDVAPHLVWARIRAVESGLPVVRVTNHGTSAVFDAFGQTVAAMRSAGEPTVLAAAIPAPIDTVYVRTGEVLLPICVLVVLTGIVPRRRWLRGRPDISRPNYPAAARRPPPPPRP